MIWINAARKRQLEKMAEEPVVLNGGLTWTKLTTLLLTVVIGTMGSNVAFRYADPPRFDPFTGKDAMLLELRIRAELKEHVLELRRKIDESDKRKPPSATRSRILAIEEHISKDGTFRKPTEDWQ